MARRFYAKLIHGPARFEIVSPSCSVSAGERRSQIRRYKPEPVVPTLKTAAARTR